LRRGPGPCRRRRRRAPSTLRPWWLAPARNVDQLEPFHPARDRWGRPRPPRGSSRPRREPQPVPSSCTASD
jgi:hypothetical protein